METDPVSLLYQRYKSGTNYVVDWLVDTVRQRQDITNILRISKLVQPRSAGKKVRRREQKFNAAKQQILLSCDDFLRLASTLSSSSLNEPSGLSDAISVTRDVIRGRRKCSRWYAKRDRDSGHEAFVRTLEQVLQALLTLCKMKKGAKGAQNPLE